MHRQAADVSSRKENRIHHVTVGGHGNPSGIEAQHRTVIHCGKELVVEGFGKQTSNQIVGGTTPTAMVQLYHLPFHCSPL